MSAVLRFIVDFLPQLVKIERTGMMEQWNDGILGPFVFHLVEKQYGSWDKQTMDRKNLDPNTEVMSF